MGGQHEHSDQQQQGQQQHSHDMAGCRRAGHCRRSKRFNPAVIFLLMLTLTAWGHAIRPGEAALVKGKAGHSIHGTMRGLVVPPGGGKAEKLRVVLVNDIAGHLEVLGCILHMLKTAGIRPTTIYTGPHQLLHMQGLFEWLGVSSDEVVDSQELSIMAEQKGSVGYDVPGLGHFHHMPNHRVGFPSGLGADLVICITPELARGECSQIVSALKPGYLVTWIHRGDMVTSNVLSIYPRQLLVALSPHVANACAETTGVPTDWAMPIAPHLDVLSPCESLSCLNGFVMQGTIRGVTARGTGKGHTRDYRTLWNRLIKLHRVAGRYTPRVHITVLGRGDASHLDVPRQLTDHITHLSGLPYPEFWSHIHHSLALLPCFGMDSYYTSRLSSTITASLITSTPLIADQRLLDTYTFLTEEHVFLQKDGEDEAAAMFRIMSMPEEEIFSRRRALATLRDELNKQSQTILSGWLSATKALSTQERRGRGGRGLMLGQTDMRTVARHTGVPRLHRRSAEGGLSANGLMELPPL